MDLVLGLAMTSRAVRWVLVEGRTGEGRPVDRGAIALEDPAGYDPEGLLRGLVDDTQADGTNLIHAIGVTWTNDAAVLASSVLQDLDERGHVNVFAVSEVEAAGMLASGIADITEHDDIAVCIIEPDAAVLAIVTSDDVTADRIERSDALVGDVTRLLALTDRPVGAMFVLGSDAQESIVTALAQFTRTEVITAAESDLAFARGAGLAAAMAVNTAVTPAKPVRWTKVGALSSILGGAAVTLVVATSAAIGLHLHPGAIPEQPMHTARAGESAPEAGPVHQPEPKAAPKPAPAAPAPAIEAANPPAQVPPAPAAPAPAPEPAYVPPAPAAPAPVPEPVYVPPAPPAYVPPPVTYPQPRLRDRIIERIPIINRFH
ncbi:hypothetical protein M2272_005722 [Mycobacterium frederiksbergense]|uniref:FHA domain-containing protein n=1 Tax=Mycolicibacterium frederiksbergense TaxID=117567 RepID=A0ABT6LAN9_9MYCO|nr:hypothetical protein [Mycolicibacterium frederiksbergense]MDH6199055.1 hypothetical protein [Mycolicibacterium frederiksbergense]